MRSVSHDKRSHDKHSQSKCSSGKRGHTIYERIAATHTHIYIHTYTYAYAYTHLAVAHADPLIEAELVGDHGLVLVVARRVLVPLEQLLAPVGEGLDDTLVLHRCVAELRRGLALGRG